MISEIDDAMEWHLSLWQNETTFWINLEFSDNLRKCTLIDQHLNWH